MKKIVFVAMIASLVFEINFAQASVELKELGRAPLMGKIESREKNPCDLTDKFVVMKFKNSEIIKMGMKGLGYDSERSRDIFDLLESHIRNDIAILETSLPIGTKFLWMGYESKKSGLQILRDVIWKGNEPMEGFLITVLFEGQELKFFIPLDCGNLSLLEINKIAVARNDVSEEIPESETPLPPSPPVAVSPPSIIDIRIYFDHPTLGWHIDEYRDDYGYWHSGYWTTDIIVVRDHFFYYHGRHRHHLGNYFYHHYPTWHHWHSNAWYSDPNRRYRHHNDWQRWQSQSWQHRGDRWNQQPRHSRNYPRQEPRWQDQQPRWPRYQKPRHRRPEPSHPQHFQNWQRPQRQPRLRSEQPQREHPRHQIRPHYRQQRNHDRGRR